MSALPALLCVCQNSERVGRFRNGSSDPSLAQGVTCEGPRMVFFACLVGLSLAGFGRAPPQTEGTERQARDLCTDSRTTLAKLPAATARSRRELKTGRAPSNHLSFTHFTSLHFAPTLHLPQPFVLLSPYTYPHLNHSFYTHFFIPFLILSILSSNPPSILYQLHLPCCRCKRDCASRKPRLLNSQAAFLYHTNIPPPFDKLNTQ